MKRKEILIIAISAAVIVFSLLTWSVYTRSLNVNRNTSIKGESTLDEYPKVNNIAPNTAIVDSVYTFKPNVSFSGNSAELLYELVDAPQWLFLQTDSMFGIPGTNDIGDHKVVLRIHNREKYIDYVFYINVDEKKPSNN